MIAASPSVEPSTVDTAAIHDRESPRDAAIRKAVELAGPRDTILVAGRGHEVWQEVKGVNIALDDRAELRSALTARGFNVLPDERIES